MTIGARQGGRFIYYQVGCKSPTNQNAPIPRYSLRYFFGLGFVMKEKKGRKKKSNKRHGRNMGKKAWMMAHDSMADLKDLPAFAHTSARPWGGT